MEKAERRIDKNLIFSIIATGTLAFTGVVIETAMNITFPTLMKEFNIDISAVQWITTGYLLILAIIIPTSAYLKRNFTLRNLFIVASIFFTLGVIVDIFAFSFPILLGGRLLQGVGAGIALPLMFNIVLEQVPFTHMGTMMGIATLIVAVSPAVGPSLGGAIIHYYGWREIFVFLLPLLIIAFLLGIFSIRQTTELQKTPFNWQGFILLAIAFTGIILGTSNAGSLGWGNARVLVEFLVGFLALAVFYWQAQKVSNPIFHTSVFATRTFTLSVLVIGIVQFVCLGLGFLIPTYAQLVSKETSLVAGFLLLPGCILGAFLAPVSGRLLDRFGAKKPILLGNIFCIIATSLYSLWAKELTAMLFVVVYMIFTVGQGFTVGNSMTNGLKQLPEKLKADGNAVCNTVQQLAGAIGTAVVASVVSAQQHILPLDLEQATMLGSREAFIVLFILACAALFSSLWIFSDLEKQERWVSAK